VWITVVAMDNTHINTHINNQLDDQAGRTPRRRPRRRWRWTLLLAMAVMSVASAGVAVSRSAPASAAGYQWLDDDYITAMTSGAAVDGSYRSNTAGLVRWWYADNGVKRGEIRPSTYVRWRGNLATKPLCIAARVRWQTITGAVTIGWPPSFSPGISTQSSGWMISCRNSAGNIASINLSGMAYSSRLIWRMHVDVCHQQTSNSGWACATDTNSYGEA
jgi:hypothetical protein